MGIKYLNKYLVTNCKDAITLTHMQELKNKTIVIDISIYLYKFQMSGSLIENMYLMLSLFDHYAITPIFVFDGKPPPEKRNLLNKRYDDRVKAASECSEIRMKLQNGNMSYEEKRALLNSIAELEKKCTHVNKKDIEQVQQLIRCYGYTYYQAYGEADELCALFVKSGKAWACLSEDMDMFVYATTRVLRYLSLLNNTMVLYDTSKILQYLGMDQQEFIGLCILSGTDYNIDTHIPVNELFDLFIQFKKNRSEKGCVSPHENPGAYSAFCHWLRNDHKQFKVLCDESISDICHIFTNITGPSQSLVENADASRGKKDRGAIQAILEADGFVYPVKCVNYT